MDQQQPEREEAEQQQTVAAYVGSAVTFQTKIKIVEIPDLSYYTDEDYDAVWYDADEYEKIAENRKRCFQRGQDLEDDETLTKDEKDASWIGTATWEESQERKERIHDARVAVFREQELQWNENIIDRSTSASFVYFYFCETRYQQIQQTNMTAEIDEDRKKTTGELLAALKKKKMSTNPEE